VTAVVIAVAGALGGCGGGSSDATGGEAFVVRADTTMTTGKLPKARFVVRVNQLCRKGWGPILDNFARYLKWEHRNLSPREQFARTVRVTLMAGIDFYIFDVIHELGAPAGEEREIERMIGAMQEAVERGQRLGPLYSVAEISALFDDFNQRARRYSLDDCLVDEPHIREIEA
jgi:hypothetical protein